jgi:hypothetical protein
MTERFGTTSAQREFRLAGSACLVIAMTLLAGCFPQHFAGYRPIGNGELEGGYCIAGIKDALRTSAPGGLQIITRALLAPRERELEISVDVVIPSGVRMRFLADHIVITSNNATESAHLRITRITRSGPTELQPLDALDGLPDKTPTLYSVWVQPVSESALKPTPLSPSPGFSISLPAMLINAQPYQPDAIAFEPYREWGIYYCIQ